jgi:hypothetical protein
MTGVLVTFRASLLQQVLRPAAAHQQLIVNRHGATIHPGQQQD